MTRFITSLSGLYITALLIILAGCAGKKNEEKDQLGELRFEVTGNEKAQTHFKKGLLLLHNFEYEDAAESFQRAREMDKECVMAYWGEAMTHNHPLWQEQDYEAGNKVLTMLANLPEDRVTRAGLEIEKDFIRAINILYGKGNKNDRDSSYAVFMESLFKKYPGNDEVAAFYSLALNGWGTSDVNTQTLLRAADIGKEVLQRNPLHPGALHYLIHAYDNPAYAAAALVTADKYARVAADAGHALHMPTHTYVALGLWDKVVNSNIVSWAAEKARKERKQLDNDALGYHAYHWLQYGYLQQGNNQAARLMLDSMQRFCAELPSNRARSHLVYLKTTYIAETRDFSDRVMEIPVKDDDLNITSRAMHHFVKGWAAFARKDTGAMEAIIRKMAGERLIDQERTADKGLRVCGNINRNMPTPTDLTEAAVMELELMALLATLEEDDGRAEKYFKEAVAQELISGYSYGPPNIIKPSFELYGEWLLENDRPDEAKAQFEKCLNVMPNRIHSIRGKKSCDEKQKSVVSR